MRKNANSFVMGDDELSGFTFPRGTTTTADNGTDHYRYCNCSCWGCAMGSLDHWGLELTLAPPKSSPLPYPL